MTLLLLFHILPAQIMYDSLSLIRYFPLIAIVFAFLNRILIVFIFTNHTYAGAFSHSGITAGIVNTHAHTHMHACTHNIFLIL